MAGAVLPPSLAVIDAHTGPAEMLLALKSAFFDAFRTVTAEGTVTAERFELVRNTEVSEADAANVTVKVAECPATTSVLAGVNVIWDKATLSPPPPLLHPES